MRDPDVAEPSQLPWIEDDASVDEALGDVVISHEGRHEPDDDGDETPS